MRVPSCGLAIISSLGFSFANGPLDVVLDGHNIPAQAMRATVRDVYDESQAGLQCLTGWSLIWISFLFFKGIDLQSLSFRGFH